MQAKKSQRKKSFLEDIIQNDLKEIECEDMDLTELALDRIVSDFCEHGYKRWDQKKQGIS
jgi:hypothetical protein